MAFAGELVERHPDRVTVWPHDESGLLDLDSLLGEPPDDTVVYCCGPEALLSAVEERCAQLAGGLPAYRAVRRQGDRTPQQDATALERFEVVCQRSGITLEVNAGDSILELVEAAGVPITTSCYEGVCGSCKAKVLEGVPEHLDSVLKAPEQRGRRHDSVYVTSPAPQRLVLDL